MRYWGAHNIHTFVALSEASIASHFVSFVCVWEFAPLNCVMCMCARAIAMKWGCVQPRTGLAATTMWKGRHRVYAAAAVHFRRQADTASSGGRRNQVHCVEYYNYQFDQWTWGTLFLFHYILLFSFALLGVCVSVCVFGHGQCSTVDHGRRDRWVCVRMTRSHFILALHIFY